MSHFILSNKVMAKTSFAVSLGALALFQGLCLQILIFVIGSRYNYVSVCRGDRRISSDHNRFDLIYICFITGRTPLLSSKTKSLHDGGRCLKTPLAQKTPELQKCQLYLLFYCMYLEHHWQLLIPILTSVFPETTYIYCISHMALHFFSQPKAQEAVDLILNRLAFSSDCFKTQNDSPFSCNSYIHSQIILQNNLWYILFNAKKENQANSIHL